MPFESDIRKPCDFTCNINFVRTIYEESEFEDELSDVAFLTITNNIEAEVWYHIVRGDAFNFPEIVFNEICSFVNRS